jgi:hypothetical protein
MARSRKKAAPDRSSAGRGAKATSRKKAAPAAVEVEVVEESKGLGIDDGIAIVTGILILAAFLMTDRYRGIKYGEGMLWAGKYEVPAE